MSLASITALILSREPITLALPDGVVALNHNETFNTTGGIHAARRRALAKVQTEHVFFMDSDDTLPTDAADVLAECLGANAALAYTDELVVKPNGEAIYRRAGIYDPMVHAGSPMMVHHLALMRTEMALEALAVIPRGDVWIEHPLFWKVAQRGAAYIPRVGYHWHRGRTGLHTAPGIVAATARGMAWCVRQVGSEEFQRRAIAHATARAQARNAAWQIPFGV